MKNHKLIFYIFYILIFSLQVIYAQELTLEDVWTKNTFQMKNIEDFKWAKSGKTFYNISKNEKTNELELVEFDILSNKKIKTILSLSNLKWSNKKIDIDDYYFSNDESKILLKTQTESIYRRSTKAVYYFYDLINKKLEAVADSQFLTQCEFSPDNNKIGFTKDNNLYFRYLYSSKTIQISQDGKKNEIINGTSDWVYEEEFEITKCFVWSNDSKKIAYLKFNETDVKEYNMQIWGNELYPEDYKFKYPKAGEKNSDVSLLIYDTETQTTKTIFDGKGKDAYIPRFQFTTENAILSVMHLNRKQDSLAIVHYDIEKNTKSVIVNLKSDTYINVENQYFYLKSSKKLVYKSNDNFRNIKILDLETQKTSCITCKYFDKKQSEIQGINGIDEKNQRIYFTAKDNPPLNQYNFSIDFVGKNLYQITSTTGVNNVEYNHDYKYYIHTYSTIDKGLKYTLYSTQKNTKIKDLESNTDFDKKLASYSFSKVEFSSFSYQDTSINTNSKNQKIDLNYYLIKPKSFDLNKKYPVLVYFYGGPGSQEVINEWQGRNYLWFQLLANKGFIVACCDNRGTGGKGIDFQHATTYQLGKLETQDQIAFGKYLQTLPFVDKNNLATFGWSFGGYLSSLCILLGADVYKAAIAVAPVTSWRFYDTIYTERYLKNPIDNTKGYDENSPLTHAAKLKGKYLLVHGTADDNVHYQNAIAMQNALIEAGKHFETYTYPDKAHGISGAKTRLHLYQKMTDFLEKNLK